MANGQRQYATQLEPWEAAFELSQIADQLNAIGARLAHIYPKLSSDVAARVDGIKDAAALDVIPDVGARLSDLADKLQEEHDAAEAAREHGLLKLARAM